MDKLQADVNQVVDVMKDNLDKVLERDAKLTHLETRAGRKISRSIFFHFFTRSISRHVTKWCFGLLNEFR